MLFNSIRTFDLTAPARFFLRMKPYLGLRAVSNGVLCCMTLLIYCWLLNIWSSFNFVMTSEVRLNFFCRVVLLGTCIFNNDKAKVISSSPHRNFSGDKTISSFSSQGGGPLEPAFCLCMRLDRSKCSVLKWQLLYSTDTLTNRPSLCSIWICVFAFLQLADEPHSLFRHWIFTIKFSSSWQVSLFSSVIQV